MTDDLLTERHAENLRAARARFQVHIGRCAWCVLAVKKLGKDAPLCATGTDLRQVVEYRRAPTDDTPR